MRRRYSVGALATADVGVLALDRPDFGGLWRYLHAPGAWLDEVGADRALAVVAAALLWLAAAWLAIGLLATLAGRLPGAPGLIAGGVTRCVLPRAVAAALAGSAGLGVLLVPAAAGAAAPPTPHPAPSVSLPAPTWPVTPRTPAASQPTSDAPTPARPDRRPLPAPRWPSSRGTVGDSPRSSPATHRPRPAMPAPTPVTTRAPRTGAGHPPKPDSPAPRESKVVVRPGDSLWLIAARRLGGHPTDAAIAAAWPHWYATNRDVIGADPRLIVPGQRLVDPSIALGGQR
jgi:hypothetical protein